MRKLLTLLLVFILLGCQSVSRDPLKKIELVTPSGEIIKTSLVYSDADQQIGLSGTKSEDFDEDEGMLFFYTEDGDKHFWMPDTYFDLDLIYTDKNLKILDIVRKAPHYIGRANSQLIPRIRGVWCRHTLEMKASSPISAKLKIGDQLTWKSGLSLSETEEKILQSKAKP